MESHSIEVAMPVTALLFYSVRLGVGGYYFFCSGAGYACEFGLVFDRKHVIKTG